MFEFSILVFENIYFEATNSSAGQSGPTPTLRLRYAPSPDALLLFFPVVWLTFTNARIMADGQEVVGVCGGER